MQTDFYDRPGELPFWTKLQNYQNTRDWMHGLFTP
jgi:hypothetical protein